MYKDMSLTAGQTGWCDVTLLCNMLYNNPPDQISCSYPQGFATAEPAAQPMTEWSSFAAALPSAASAHWPALPAACPSGCHACMMRLHRPLPLGPQQLERCRLRQQQTAPLPRAVGAVKLLRRLVGCCHESMMVLDAHHAFTDWR